MFARYIDVRCARWWRRCLRTSLASKFILTFAFLSAAACGNGGRIEFDPGFVAKTSKGPGFNLVPASNALVVESGKNVSTGYHAKVQLNTVKGTQLTGSGYAAKLKYTARNR